ncbi:MAG: hypothetical protein GY803_11655 [Chloroflexi bacterium]|nr:hypothetical protein [Chloroflexota bacterium]
MLQSGESQSLAFIASPNRAHAWRQTLAAFSNAPKGGTILLGVLPDGRVRGLHAEIQRARGRANVRDNVDKQVWDTITPPSAVVTTEWVDTADGPVLILQVFRGPQFPYRYDNRFYIRAGARTRAATASETEALQREAAQRKRRHRRNARLERGLAALTRLTLAALMLFVVGIGPALFLWTTPKLVYQIDVDGDWLDYPRLSPDGEHLVFSHGGHGSGQWFTAIVNVQTGAQHLLPAKPNTPWAAVWAADGNSLFFHRHNQPEIYQYFWRRDELRVVGQCPAGERPSGPVAVHPRLPRLVINCGYEGTTASHFFTLDLESGQVTRIPGLPEGVYLGAPRFTPDGRDLLFEVRDHTAWWDTTESALWQLDWETGNALRRLSFPVQQQRPAPAPGGELLYYSTGPLTDGALILAAPWPALDRVLFVGRHRVQPSFSDDGRWMAFISHRGARDAVYVARPLPVWMLKMDVTQTVLGAINIYVDANRTD